MEVNDESILDDHQSGFYQFYDRTGCIDRPPVGSDDRDAADGFDMRHWRSAADWNSIRPVDRRSTSTRAAIGATPDRHNAVTAPTTRADFRTTASIVLSLGTASAIVQYHRR